MVFNADNEGEAELVEIGCVEVIELFLGGVVGDLAGVDEFIAEVRMSTDEAELGLFVRVFDDGFESEDEIFVTFERDLFEGRCGDPRRMCVN